MRRLILASLALMWLAIWPGLALADIYVWVDSEGVSHFTNLPTDNRYKVFIKEKDRIHLRPSACGADLESHIQEAARLYDVDSALVKAVIKAESSFDPMAVSRAGAQGLMQLMPATAREVACTDAFDPKDNIQGGVRYLRKLMDLFGDVGLALAAYNAGPEAVMRYRGLPPYNETRTYVDRVLKYYAQYRQGSL